MDIDSFFGFESAEFKYDARKHLQIILNDYPHVVRLYVLDLKSVL